jgi:hypothetical protein
MSYTNPWTKILAGFFFVWLLMDEKARLSCHGTERGQNVTNRVEIKKGTHSDMIGLGDSLYIRFYVFFHEGTKDG